MNPFKTSPLKDFETRAKEIEEFDQQFSELRNDLKNIDDRIHRFSKDFESSLIERAHHENRLKRLVLQTSEDNDLSNEIDETEYVIRVCERSLVELSEVVDDLETSKLTKTQALKVLKQELLRTKPPIFQNHEHAVEKTANNQTIHQITF